MDGRRTVPGRPDARKRLIFGNIDSKKIGIPPLTITVGNCYCHIDLIDCRSDGNRRLGSLRRCKKRSDRQKNRKKQHPLHFLINLQQR